MGGSQACLAESHPGRKAGGRSTDNYLNPSEDLAKRESHSPLLFNPNPKCPHPSKARSLLPLHTVSSTVSRAQSSPVAASMFQAPEKEPRWHPEHLHLSPSSQLTPEKHTSPFLQLSQFPCRANAALCLSCLALLNAIPCGTQYRPAARK